MNGLTTTPSSSSRESISLVLDNKRDGLSFEQAKTDVSSSLGTEKSGDFQKTLDDKVKDRDETKVVETFNRDRKAKISKETKENFNDKSEKELITSKKDKSSGVAVQKDALSVKTQKILSKKVEDKKQIFHKKAISISHNGGDFNPLKDLASIVDRLNALLSQIQGTPSQEENKGKSSNHKTISLLEQLHSKIASLNDLLTKGHLKTQGSNESKASLEEISHLLKQVLREGSLDEKSKKNVEEVVKQLENQIRTLSPEINKRELQRINSLETSQVQTVTPAHDKEAERKKEAISVDRQESPSFVDTLRSIKGDTKRDGGYHHENGQQKGSASKWDSPVDGASSPPSKQTVSFNQYVKNFDSSAQIINHNAVLQRLSSQIRSAQMKGDNRIVVQLYPENLGKVHVELTKSGDSFSVKMWVHSLVVKDIIESKMGDFKNQLENSSIHFGEVQVGVRNDNPHSEQGKEEKSSIGSDSTKIVEVPEDSSFFEGSSLSLRKNENGLLDIVA